MDKKSMPSKVWDDITYPFPNFNGSTVEVLEWISNFTPHIMMDVITYPRWDQSWKMWIKGATGQAFDCVLWVGVYEISCYVTSCYDRIRRDSMLVITLMSVIMVALVMVAFFTIQMLYIHNQLFQLFPISYQILEFTLWNLVKRICLDIDPTTRKFNHQQAQ